MVGRKRTLAGIVEPQLGLEFVLSVGWLVDVTVGGEISLTRRNPKILQRVHTFAGSDLFHGRHVAPTYLGRRHQVVRKAYAGRCG